MINKSREMIPDNKMKENKMINYENSPSYGNMNDAYAEFIDNGKYVGECEKCEKNEECEECEDNFFGFINEAAYYECNDLIHIVCEQEGL